MLIRRALMGIVLPIVAGLVLAACGGNSHDNMDMGSTSSGTRTVHVQMTDLAFAPSAISVKAGETLKFVFSNKGNLEHDAFIGDAAAQMQHGMAMSATGSGMTGHDMGRDGGITVKPGASGTLTMTFATTGPLEIGCHEPGHYEAGMKANISVA